MKRKKLWAVVLFLLFVYLNNTSLFIKAGTGKPKLLAHRGLGQTFHMEGITARTNTASRIYKPEHPFLENTIPSIQAAFNCGADMVEFDIHPTKDRQFAVFHDDVLEYRTNDSGMTEEHSLQELQALDIGYGYTADSSKTFPFRGKGIGMMPSLEQVLDRFPDKNLLIHIKSDEANVGIQLAGHLLKLPTERLNRLAVYGGDDAIAALKKLMPDLRVTSKAIIKRSLGLYAVTGWTGYIPQALRHSMILLPEKYAPFIWGWPHRFLQRMNRADTWFFLVKDGGNFSGGFDTIEDLRSLPDHYTGGIWTNRVDRIGSRY